MILAALVTFLMCTMPITSISADDSHLTRINVHIDRTYQTIVGFGASGAWWPSWVKDFPRDEQLKMLRLLFTGEGAGLNIYRYNIPAGGSESVTHRYRRTVDTEVSPGTYDFSQDKAAIGFLRDIRDLGVERFVLFANSPPVRMTQNGRTSGGENGASNLNPDSTNEFASYLVDAAEYMDEELGLPEITISPINEPQWFWGRDNRIQEGCHYNPEQATRTIRTLIDEINTRNLNYQVEAPESGSWSVSKEYALSIFSDPVIDKNINTYAVHSYWSNPKQKHDFTQWFNATYPDKTLSMTEFCEMRRVHDTGINGGLHLANVMHDDLTIGSVITWQWWLAIADGGYADGLIYANPRSKTIEVTKRLWVMAHYARFISPGSKRIEVSTDNDLIKVSGYIRPDQRTGVLVMINPNEESHNVQLDAPAQSTELHDQYWVTTDDVDLQPTKLTAGQIGLPPKSVATLLFSLGSDRPIPADTDH